MDRPTGRSSVDPRDTTFPLDCCCCWCTTFLYIAAAAPPPPPVPGTPTPLDKWGIVVTRSLLSISDGYAAAVPAKKRNNCTIVFLNRRDLKLAKRREIHLFLGTSSYFHLRSRGDGRTRGQPVEDTQTMWTRGASE